MSARIGSLFSGSGMLDEGVRAVLGGDVAWHAEIEPGACAVLDYRYPGVPNLGDITTVDWSRVERVAVLTGGFPCQDVSAAGKRAGLRDGTRSGLWARMLDAIVELQPRLVVAENVRGLTSARGAESDELDTAEAEVARLTRVLALIESKRARALREGKEIHARRHATDRVRIMGQRRRAVVARRSAERRIVRALGTVLGQLADVGYDAAWYGLRAADVGAPHGRFRIFILAWPAEDTDSAARRERRLATPRQAPGGRPRANTGGPDRVRTAAHTDGDALREQPVTEPRCGGSAVAGHACPDAAPDAGDDGCEGGQELDREPARRSRGARRGHAHGRAGTAATADTAGSGEPVEPSSDDRHSALDSAQLGASAGDRTRGIAEGVRVLAGDPGVAWGPYGAAIERWERVLGRPAPAPTEPGPRGGQRLSPRLTEWMMGWPDGWVTDVPGISRNDALKICGNGVVPQQAAEAIRRMLLDSARCAA